MFIGTRIPAPVRILPDPTPQQRAAIDAQMANNPFKRIYAPGSKLHGKHDLGAMSRAIKRDPAAARVKCTEAGENPDEWIGDRTGHTWTNRMGR